MQDVKRVKDVVEVKCEVNKWLHVTKHCVLTAILGNIWRELRAFANQSLERKSLLDAERHYQRRNMNGMSVQNGVCLE